MFKTLTQRWYLGLVLAIVIFSAVIRFYQLGEVPHGLTWDEAAIGYNGYAIWKTRRDEWLVKLPVSFRSFGDYKAPAGIYLNGASTAIFGLNPWAMRLPFAIFGVAGVLGMIFLVKEWSRAFVWSEQQGQLYSLVAGLIMATSPWHIHYSRTGFESGMALTLMIWSMAFLLRGVESGKVKPISLALSVLAAVTSVYTYHSAKLVVPVVFLALLWNRRQIYTKKYHKWFALYGVAGVLMLIPLIKDSLYGKGLERAGTLIVAKTSSFIELATVLTKQFLAHLSPTFLVMGETHSLRHGDGHWGVFLFPVLILLILGVIFKIKVQLREGWLTIFTWIGVGILPAALGSELVPHSNRALLALPGFILLAIQGFLFLERTVFHSQLNKKIIGSHGEKNMVWISVLGTFLLWYSLLFVRYTHDYFAVFARESATDFNDGCLEAFNYVKNLEADYSKIVFSDEYGQPYIYALFARKTNPIWYQGGSLVKYEFKNVNIGDLSRENTIIVGSGLDLDLPNENADKLIYGSDGQVRFKIYLRK